MWLNIRTSMNMIKHINRSKEKNFYYLHIVAENVVDKTQYLFLITTHGKT